MGETFHWDEKAWVNEDRTKTLIANLTKQQSEEDFKDRVMKLHKLFREIHDKDKLEFEKDLKIANEEMETLDRLVTEDKLTVDEALKYDKLPYAEAKALIKSKKNALELRERRAKKYTMYKKLARTMDLMERAKREEERNRLIQMRANKMIFQNWIVSKREAEVRMIQKQERETKRKMLFYLESEKERLRKLHEDEVDH